MADEHGDYFSNAIDSAKVTNLVEKDFEKHPSVESIRKAYQGLQYGFNEIGSGEVENELKMIKSNKATRWDVNCQRSSTLLKKSLQHRLLEREIGQTRGNGFLFKKGDKTNRGNYRPTTVLNSIDKVSESLPSNQITKTMDPDL